MKCSAYSDLRKILFNVSKNVNNKFIELCDMDKFIYIMSSSVPRVIHALGKYIEYAMKARDRNNHNTAV